MRQYFHSVLERRREYTTSFETEPYEVAWAGEAIFFIEVEEICGIGTRLKARVQISAAGINWVDEGTRFADITERGAYFVKVARFGGWLRLRCEVSGKDPRIKSTIHLVCKE